MTIKQISNRKLRKSTRKLKLMIDLVKVSPKKRWHLLLLLQLLSLSLKANLKQSRFSIRKL